MKKLLTAAFLSFAFLPVSAVTFQEQLEQMNSTWASHRSMLLSGTNVSFSDDRSFIQAHFAAVEMVLRSADVSVLSTVQLAARNRNIEILHAYAARGIFPHNTCSFRTPVFIDEFNTHCAVGHLMQQSGHDALAVRISSRNNLVHAIDIDDPEMYAWQQASGFTMEELALIQPGYMAPPEAFEQQYACTTAYFETYAYANWSKSGSQGEQHAEPKPVWYSGECSNGVLEGKWEQYHSPGNIWIRGTFKNGKKDGEWKYYTQRRQNEDLLQKLETWVDGKLHGPFASYDYAGKKTSEGNYVNGLKNGTWQYWQQGILSMKEFYKDGKLDGEKFQYWTQEQDEARKVAQHDVYRDGVLQTRERSTSPGVLWEKLYHIGANRYRAEYFISAGKVERTGEVLLTMRRDTFFNEMYGNLPPTYHEYEVLTKVGRWKQYTGIPRHLGFTDDPWTTVTYDSACLYYRADSVYAMTRYWKKQTKPCYDTTSFAMLQPYQPQQYYYQPNNAFASERWVYEDGVLTQHIATLGDKTEFFRFEYQNGQLMNGSRRYPLTGKFHETWNISTFTNPPILYYQQFDQFGHLVMKGPVTDTTTRYGTWEFYDQAGTVIAKGEYVNGLKEGTWMETNPDGSVWTGEYQRGRKKGTWKSEKEGKVIHAKF